ncbi:MAG: [protein-PII] uridylyltransferase [Sphingomonadaceae bacterium]
MTIRFDSLHNRRAIIDRRALADALAALEGKDATVLRSASVAILKPAFESGRAEIAVRLAAKPQAGHDAAAAQAFLTDQVLRLIYDFTTQKLYRQGNPTSSERLCLVAVGGYGRGEMAPYSDVDIAFLTPYKQTGWSEQVIESILYTLWDLGLKIGHSSRSLDDMIRMAKGDLTIRTALLESRYVWGDQPLYDEAAARFGAEVLAGTARAFVTEKLAERDARHKRMGDSRYVVEPNLKEGKGGLRDLHTLFWIGKYMHRVGSVAELVERGLLTKEELRQFQKAENFLWAVRGHLHAITRRGEERLTFDVQREIATRMRYQDRPGRSAVERFMQHYFLIAKQVGDLTGVFLAHLDDSFAPKGRRFALAGFRRAPRQLEGFVLDRGRLALPSDDFFSLDPLRLIEIFALADQHGLEIHPQAMRAASRDARLIDVSIKGNARANELFLNILTSPRDPETVLRWMNEATVFGRFVPDFGRVVAQMQFDMYHHYTVDEHSIRAIGLLARIEKGDLGEDHPIATAILKQIVSRRVLYLAVLLHDIAKGRGGDHSILGAEVAMKLCPRFGMSAAETETVAWLVRTHLLMSATAFKRDLSDFKTILDFAQAVQSPERLRLLLVLTVVDIRAVGPGVWNSWKRQLLGDLFDAAEEVLRLGHKQTGRKERIAAKQAGLAVTLGWPEAAFGALAARLPESYWIAEPDDILESNARHVAAAAGASLAIAATVYRSRGATLVTVYAADHPGLFYRAAGAIHLAGGSIIDARIHTTRDGMALDNFLIQDPFGQPFDEPSRLKKIERAIEEALANRNRLTDELAARPLPRTRAEAFTIAPNVLIDNHASNRYTVIEVNARDRPALLNALAYALFQSRTTIHSAHIATYGERAVDTFYVTDLTGDKISAATRLKALETALLDAAAGTVAEAKAA